MIELSDRERGILLTMLGPEPYRRLSNDRQQLEDLAHDWGVTVERVRQIWSRLLHRLRNGQPADMEAAP